MAVNVVGETIKDFKILARLGKGGMGEVWVAEQQIIKTKVAIKLLLGDVSTDKQQVQRFFNEAIAVSKIKHSGIVKIYDVGFHSSGQAYLIMELLEGETLASRIQRAGRLPLGQVADVGKQIASVLAATHAAGITHRDLKPDNIFLVGDAELASRERAKILDFGIAKLTTSTSMNGMTGTGTSMGTPAYMAPEQWNDAAKADARADVYSLGCVLFEMCCRRPPFVPTSIGEACTKHLHEAPPHVRSLVPELPGELDDVIDRMLAKKPEDRPTMVEVGAVFAAIAVGNPPGLDATMLPTSASSSGSAMAARPVTPAPHRDTTLGNAAGSAAIAPRPQRRGTAMFVVIGVLVLAGGGGAAYLATHRGHDVVVPEVNPTLSPKPVPSAAETPPSGVIANPFVTIAPPPKPVTLGIGHVKANIHRADTPGVLQIGAIEIESGFEPGRNIHAPTSAYAIQEHEVTWSEVDPWLHSHNVVINYPPWATDAMKRTELPATNVTWANALAYCQSLGGSLPTEEQWEYAARGADLRPNSWGSETLDPMFTHVYAGSSAVPLAVKSSSQDQTPMLADGHRLFDLVGNVQEWTSNLWRENEPDKDESWALNGDASIRAIRGLPLDIPLKEGGAQSEGAAYREKLCATGPCVEKSLDKLRYVGFRCAKGVVAAAIVPASSTEPAPSTAPTPSTTRDSAKPPSTSSIVSDSSKPRPASGPGSVPAPPPQTTESKAETPPTTTATNTSVAAQECSDTGLATAKEEYGHGNYSKAIELATQVGKGDNARCALQAQRIVGAASCFLKDRAGAVKAWNRVDAQGRTLIKYTCSKNGIEIQ